jgi:hypothetical protein
LGSPYVRDQLIVRGDATQTAQNIVGAERLSLRSDHHHRSA